MLNTLKGIYQTVEARAPQLWCDKWYTYSKEDAINKARNSLGDRITNHKGDLNFLLFIPIVNWETILIDNFSVLGSCHHCNIESSGFFESSDMWKKYKTANTENIINFFEEYYDEAKLNIVFLYLSEFHFDINAVKYLKKKDSIVINFNWDDILHYKRIHNGQSVGISKLAEIVDLNLTMSISSLTRYVNDGAAVFYWEGLSNLDDSIPDIKPKETDKVLFYGSKYGYRENIINYLVKKGVPLEIYGQGWGTDFISYEELYRKIKTYALNLGISTIGYTRGLCCFKGRDLEVPLNGGLYIVNDHPEITHVYRPNIDVLVYRDKSECYLKISDVLEFPEKYAEIKRTGQKTAKSLSWDSRNKYLLNLIKRIISN